jgi:L-threonylcarbamoyladenylate synthase
MAQPTSSDLAEAVRILRGGGLVAFPTETVYGVGADATNSIAVGRIFTAKGRPPTNPLIVHVASSTAARRYAALWPDHASKLAAAFWPGPLTLVLPKTPQIISEVTAGRNTVGLRVPNHPVALDLLAAFDGPLAAPSANRSGRVSPTTAQHAQDDLGNRVDLILDGGPCQVGIESTVLDLSSPRPMILRPGGVSREQIEALIGPVDTFVGSIAPDAHAPSPGLLPVHYSPQAPMFRFEACQLDRLNQWCREHSDQPAIILVFRQLPHFGAAASQRVILMPSDPIEYARKLYSTLHAADNRRPAAIWVQMPPDEAIWNAVRDRLTRASKSS